ncbi:MAG: prolipoprotein diacylglyceryl transferase [Patescibacteria group bacterium]|jgi:phosphatidylglycerol:prolipoprotein diacylglycerol transferase
MSYYEIKRIGIAAGGLLICTMIGWWLHPYFAGLKEIQPVIFQLGIWQIRWYGVLMASAVVLALLGLSRLAKATIWEPHILGLVTSAVGGGIIGARLLFVILKWSEFASTPLEIFNLPGGGLSIHGALLGGAVMMFWYCRAHQLSFGAAADMIVPWVALGQMIGRFGNFFNQEAFGGPTSSPWKMWITPALRPEAWQNYSWFHPTFLYESIGLLIVLLILLIAQRKQLPAGTVAFVYTGAYSVLRFGIEFFRIDSDKWGNLTVAQWGSLVIILISLIGGLILRYSSRPKL